MMQFICPECKSKNTDIDYYQDCPEIEIKESGGKERYHIYCLDCDHDFIEYLDMVQSGLFGNAGIVIPVPKKKIKKSYESSQDNKNYDIPTSFNNAYKSSREFRIDGFKEYLDRTAHTGFNILFDDESFINIPYKHRWSKSYQRGVMRKLYQLDIFFRRHSLKCGMISLTSAQSGLTDFEILNKFKESWQKFANNLNKRGYQYFKLYEPHGSGIPHIHCILIGDLSEDKINELEDLWHNKYEMGAESIDFKFSSPKNAISNLKNYLMKYLSKTVISDIMNDPQLLRFHSLFWETKSRLFSSSRYLSFIMKSFKNKPFATVTRMFIGNKKIYDKSESKAYKCKYQQIEGIRYKYRLCLHEIKNKFNWALLVGIDNNFNISKMFNLWRNEFSW